MSKSRLMDEVVSLSESESDVCTQWEVIGMHKAMGGESLSCVCGKTKLKTCFIIKNKHNGNVVDNVGSECVRHFANEEMVNNANLFEMGLKRKVPMNARFGSKTYAETYERCKHARDPIYYAMDDNNLNYSRKWNGFFDYVNMRLRCATR